MQATPKTYVPILKSKEGEYTSFPALDPNLRKMVMPLFEVLPFPSADADADLTSVVVKLEKNLKTWPILFVDLALVAPSVRTTAGVHPVKFLFDALRPHRINAVPVTGIGRSTPYQKAVAEAVSKDNRGLCLRIKADEVDDDLSTKIDAVLAAIGCTPTDTHLILDFASISKGGGAATALLARTILAALPHLLSWKTLTVAGTAFPQSLAGVPADGEESIERAEWTAWGRLRAGNLKRIPGFGDYTISHPEMVEFDPTKMSMSASIRYTSNGNWLCLKGRSTKKNGFGQFHTLSAKLIRRPEYAGAAFSLGDGYINDCAARRAGPGNMTTWRRVGNVHHITSIAGEIAKLP